jgi:hypothetical protein
MKKVNLGGILNGKIEQVFLGKQSPDLGMHTAR